MIRESTTSFSLRMPVIATRAKLERKVVLGLLTSEAGLGHNRVNA